MVSYIIRSRADVNIVPDVRRVCEYKNGGYLLRKLVIGIKGAGEMASGIAHCLYRSNLRQIFMMEVPAPLAVRRRVSFCSAVTDGKITIEAVCGVRAKGAADVRKAWEKHQIPVVVDPQWRMVAQLTPDVVIDAILAKKNLGTTQQEAALVIGLGPGFTAGEDVHVVIETNRGHHLGRQIVSGTAAEDTGVPGEIGGYAAERVLRSPADGCFVAEKAIGDRVRPAERVGRVDGRDVRARIEGMLRGLILSGSTVTEGLKIGDIDPRGRVDYCHTISDKARAIGGAVLTAVMMTYNQLT